MTKVLRVISTIDPTVGGPSRSAVNAAIAETTAEVQTTLITTGIGNELERAADSRQALDQAGVKLFEFPRLKLLGYQGKAWGLSLAMAVWMARNIRGDRFDVVHLHYVWSLPTVLGAFLATRAGLPVVLTGHESLTRYDIDVTSGSPLKRRLKLGLRKFLMPRVDAVVAASEIELRDSTLPGEYARVIPHPVSRLPRTRAPGASERTVFGYLGRLHPKKGIERLLRSLGTLGPDFRLIVCGDGAGDYPAELRALAEELGVDDRVEWRGHVDEAGKTQLFESVHWMVMPSDYECFGMAGAEALSAGVPVIATSRTGIAPLISGHSCGLVVELEEGQAGLDAALGDAARRIAAGETEALSENALAAGEALGFASYGSQVEDLYRILVHSR